MLSCICLSALLVWRLLAKFGLKSAWLGGLIFAVHPMMVESVAWISELKNTLSLPPFLLAMCAYIDYEERGRKKDYYKALAFFLVAMLCKISMATFPAIILVYVWWKKGRIGSRDFLASIPFFVISLVLGLVTILCGSLYRQHEFETPPVVEIAGFFSRVTLAGQTLSFYFAKCFFPVGPLPVYPQWKIDPSSPIQFLPWLVLIGVLYVLWKERSSWGRHLLLGVGFFILLLVPFLGFISVSYMSFTWVMDHFLYIPIIGLIGIVVAGFESTDGLLSTRFHPGSGILPVMVGLLAVEAHWYAEAFTSNETLWTYTVERNPDSWLARDDLGNALRQAGELDKARMQYEYALKLNPDLPDLYSNLASVLAPLGRVPEAVEALNQALERDPDHPEANNNLGIILAKSGYISEALIHFEKALSRRPLYAVAHNNMGNTLLQVGRTSEAVDQYAFTVTIRPDFVGAHCNMGIALEKLGRISEAEEQFQIVLNLDPQNTIAQDHMEKLTTLPSAPSWSK